MEMYKDLARLMMATEASPLVLGNAEFWIDASGPWAGMLSYSPEPKRWNNLTIATSLTQLAKVYPEVNRIVARYNVR